MKSSHQKIPNWDLQVAAEKEMLSLKDAGDVRRPVRDTRPVPGLLLEAKKIAYDERIVFHISAAGYLNAKPVESWGMLSGGGVVRVHGGCGLL